MNTRNHLSSQLRSYPGNKFNVYMSLEKFIQVTSIFFVLQYLTLRDSVSDSRNSCKKNCIIYLATWEICQVVHGRKVTGIICCSASFYIGTCRSMDHPIVRVAWMMTCVLQGPGFASCEAITEDPKHKISNRKSCHPKPRPCT